MVPTIDDRGFSVSTEAIRIGGASAFLGDSSIAVPQLLRGGSVDYIILDYLAEVTTSILARSREKNPAKGYAPYFVEEVIANNLPEITRQKTKIITNAGGLNPMACRDAVLGYAERYGLELKVATVEGDDLNTSREQLVSTDVMEMTTGQPLPEDMLSINAYLGAGPIVAALEMGADIVITGRVVDTALTLAPLIHEFAWPMDNYDLLAAGSLAGHIIECGAQATGGLHTDWETVPDWANIGYPVVECYADGRFLVQKPDDTGGLITPAVVGEQLLYEVGDPQAYLLPDVACDFSQVRISQVAKNSVEVRGAIGRPPSGSYKVSGTYQDGYRCIAVSPVIGIDAEKKAKRMAEALISRTRNIFAQRDLGDYRAILVECIGAEASYGDNARALDTREVACKIALEHENPKALTLFVNEAFSPTTSMSPGTTGWFAGRPTVEPVVRLFSFLYPKSKIDCRVSIDDDTRLIKGESIGTNHSIPIIRPQIKRLTLKKSLTTVPLIKLAWARSGDKGNTFNVGVIAREPDYLPYIRASLSEDIVFEFMRHVFDGADNPKIECFEVPGINALNFLFHDSLGGGQMASLRIDPLAKGMAQQMLEMPIDIPIKIIDEKSVY